MDRKQPEKIEKKKIEWTYIETIFCISAALIIFVPLLLTRSWGLPSFKDTGPIGDTIGGTTAPFIGLLSAWLVYRALKAQIDANKIITDQFREQKVFAIVNEQLAVLREEIKEFVFIQRIPGYGDITSQGVHAIKNCLNVYPKGHSEIHYTILMEYHESILEIDYFLENIHYLLRRIQATDLNKGDKIHLIKKVGEIYLTRLYKALLENKEKRSSQQEFCDQCNFRHGLPEFIYVKHDSIKEILIKNGYNFS